ncbi:MAG: hypothetical protein M1820_003283 [Bogoriella megaspora]|nr:MAG: hypothetical protein M1820_003283 [Bogoriella megaspora]
MEFMSSLQSGLDELKPSLFELLSEQQLASLIPPSLRYLLALATHRHPRYLLRILNSFDEVYAVIILLVERHFLRTYGGGFTENFYGLKRERVLRIKGGEVPRAQLGAADLVRETLKLRDADIWKNLAVMVGLPYLKRKLDESFDIHAPQATILGPNFRGDTLPHNATLKQRFMHYYKWFLRNIYPSVNAAYYFSLLAFNLAYLFDGSKYHSPFLWLIGTRIRRLGAADHHAIELAKQPKPVSGGSARPGQSNSLLNPRTLGQAVYPRLLSSLRFVLPTSIFALKFLEWWHASDFAHQLAKKATEGIELPPPIVSGLPPKSTKGAIQSGATTLEKQPPAEPNAPSTSGNPARKPPLDAQSLLPILTVPPSPPPHSDLCPICLRPVVTPTAAQTGYVFCYTCIFKWVDGSHERQEAFMEGGGGEEGWEQAEGSRKGRWESGKGRCAVTGKRVLGGTEWLRRVMV